MTAVSSSAHAVLISGRAARARTLTLKDGRVVASRVIERGVASGRNGSCAAFQTHPAAGYCSYPQWCTVRLLVPPCGPGDILTMAHCNSNGRVVVKFKRGASSMARVLGHQANC